MSEGSKNSSWILVAVLVVVVGGLVAIALTRGPEQFDPDTAEGTVQEYLVALDEQRFEDALEVVHPELASICSADDLRQMRQGDFTARLGHVNNSDVFTQFDTVGEEFPGRVDLPAATDYVEVTITHNDVGFGSSWDEYVVFELATEDGFYWLVGDPWPYFTWSCEGGF